MCTGTAYLQVSWKFTQYNIHFLPVGVEWGQCNITNNHTPGWNTTPAMTCSTSCNMDISGDHLCTRLHSSKTLLMGWFLIVPLVLYPRPFIRLLGQGKFSWPVYGLYFSTPVQIFCCFLFTAVIIDNDPMTLMLTGRFNDVMGYCHFCRLWGQSMNVLITGTCIQVRC